METISVVIPVYKTPERDLRACLDSIRSQTHRELEILLVDDGSPDHCGDVCEEYARRDPRFRVLHQENQGVSAARNAALRIASGRYLTFVDADDCVASDAFASALDALERHQAQCAVFGWREERENGKMAVHQVSGREKCIPAELAAEMIARDDLLCGGGYPWNKLWDTQALREEQGSLPLFDEDLYTYEDKYWILQCLLKVKRVICLPRILYQYRYAPTGLSKGDDRWEGRILNGLEAYEKIIALLEPVPGARRAAIRFYSNFLIDKTYRAMKGMRWNLPHFQRMMQHYRKNEDLLSLSQMENARQAYKYLRVRQTVFWL